MSAPVITCFALAQLLGPLHQSDTELDRVPTTPRTTEEQVERHNAKETQRRLYERTEAIEDLILATPATALQDAAAQVMIAVAKINFALGFENADGELEKARHGLLSALFALAAVAGVAPADVAYENYEPYRPWGAVP